MSTRSAPLLRAKGGVRYKTKFPSSGEDLLPLSGTPAAAASGGGGMESSVAADLELDRPNLEDYLSPDALPQESPKNLHLRDLLDISPVLTEAAGAIVDNNFYTFPSPEHDMEKPFKRREIFLRNSQ